jgi:hypothetical protein
MKRSPHQYSIAAHSPENLMGQEQTLPQLHHVPNQGSRADVVDAI